MRRIGWLVVCLWLLAGCGGAPGTGVSAPAGGPPGPPGAASFPPARASVAKQTVHASGNLTVNLAAGWNAVGLERPTLSSVTANPQIAGLAYYQGGSYHTAAFSLEDLNTGAGGRRGLYLFATAPTAFSYSGSPDTLGQLALSAGWNLVSLAGPGPIAGSSLTATVGGVPVPLTSVLFRRFYQVEAESTLFPVDVAGGGSLQGGKAYWVYSLQPSILSWTPVSLPPELSLRFVTDTFPTGGTVMDGHLLQVEVVDEGGARVSSSATIELQLVSSPPGSTLTGTLERTASNGLATFSGLQVDKPGTYRFRATSPNVPDGDATSPDLTLTFGPPQLLNFIAQPTSGIANQSLTPTTQVEILDGKGNRVENASNAVHLIKTGGPGTLGGTVDQSAINGVASFPDLTLSLPGTYGLLATAGPLGSANCDPFEVDAGGPHHLSYSVPPSAQTTAGEDLTPAVVVEVRDQFDNRVGSDNGTNITVSIAPGVDSPPGSRLRPDGSTSVSVETLAGQATFGNLHPNQLGSYRLTAAGPGLAPIAHDFEVLSGAPSSLQVNPPHPVTQLAGTLLNGSGVTVQAFDSQSNLAIHSGDSITLSLVGEGGLFGTLTQPLVNGMATFPDVGAYALARNIRIRATCSSADGQTSPFDVARELINRQDGPNASRVDTEMRDSRHQTISADGRYVLFCSNDPSLPEGNGCWQVYRRDRWTGATAIASSNNGSPSQSNEIERPVISADGNFVAFNDTTDYSLYQHNGWQQIYVKDMTTGTLRFASPAWDNPNAGASEHAVSASISADGRYVAFDSWAPNLVPNFDGGGAQVYRHDLLTGTTELVSRRMGGSASQAGYNTSFMAHISDDGQRIAFDSHATELVNLSAGAGPQIYLRDMSQPNVILVSRRQGGTASQGSSTGCSFWPSLSGNGRYVAFCTSAATDVFVTTTGVGQQAFRWDSQSGSIQLISRSFDHAGPADAVNDHCDSVQLSADGDEAVFLSRGNNVTPGVAVSQWQGYCRRIQAGTTHHLTSRWSGPPSFGTNVLAPVDGTIAYISPNGELGAFYTPWSDSGLPEATASWNMIVNVIP